MKRNYFAVCASIVMAFMFTACKKDAALNSNYYIKLKIDGVARTFTANTMAHITPYGAGMNGAALSVTGGVGLANEEGIHLGINFYSKVPAAGGYSATDAKVDYELGGVYSPGSTTIVYNAITSHSSALPLSITISKIDSKEIKGTFQGAFYKTDSSASGTATEYKTFTEGEFDLPVSK